MSKVYLPSSRLALHLQNKGWGVVQAKATGSSVGITPPEGGDREWFYLTHLTSRWFDVEHDPDRFEAWLRAEIVSRRMRK